MGIVKPHANTSPIGTTVGTEAWVSPRGHLIQVPRIRSSAAVKFPHLGDGREEFFDKPWQRLKLPAQ